MTKNRSMRIAILVLALALLTSCFVGSTFAKYTSESSGTATVTVADWSFDLNNGTNIVESNTFTFGLFNTIKEADTTTTESDVAETRIAPGTGGEFAIALKNTSEVSATYSVVLDAEASDLKSIPLEFSTDKTNWKSIDQLEAKEGELLYNAETPATASVTIYWRWAFTDTVENSLAGTTDVKVVAKVTATQKD